MNFTVTMYNYPRFSIHRQNH
ncbi:hypothetical protein CGLO_13915 [Colletotrichum gloeosporioides Cg-14]|uniref:Uncharacterized protein n=1 Tax=Colletotrichum gloeosporioides (strain Cg-14) TaxID=1237896 RepID=T0K508_COLGC|nr:hypothetical protein CGLO_13915 [Colletotrichum gloeosporioides Cg-14]